MLAKKEAAKRGVATDSVPTRAKLTPCIDPEFRMLTPLLKQVHLIFFFFWFILILNI